MKTIAEILHMHSQHHTHNIVIDVGAQQGLVSLLAASIGKHTTVIAFETALHYADMMATAVLVNHMPNVHLFRNQPAHRVAYVTDPHTPSHDPQKVYAIVLDDLFFPHFKFPFQLPDVDELRQNIKNIPLLHIALDTDEAIAAAIDGATTLLDPERG
eukprot:2208574-Rhodomonas_salina.1